MLYRNTSKKPVFIAVNMNKTLIQPGQEIYMSPHDINHSGTSMRFFESVQKLNAVKEDNWDKPSEEKTMKDVIEEKQQKSQEVKEPETALEQPETAQNSPEVAKEESQPEQKENKAPEKELENKERIAEETT